jgi:DDE superfamily endonuclease
MVTTRTRSSKRTHTHYRPLTPDQRRRILHLHDTEQLGASLITQRFRAAGETVARTTVQRCLTEHKLEPLPMGGYREEHHTDVDIEQEICDIVDADADVTAEGVQLMLDNAHAGEPYYHSPRPRTIRDILYRRGFSFKIMRNRPVAYNSMTTKHARWRYVTDIAKPLLRPGNSVFIDETPFASHHRRSKGWSRMGSPALRRTSVIRGANHSVIAAISPTSGLLHYHIKKTEKSDVYVTKGVGEQVFAGFTQDLLKLPLFKQRSKYYFCVMDNVNFHKSEEVKNLYNARHQHILLPPYSPFLNPIEFIFSQWKVIYKRMPHRNDREVVDSIHASAQELNMKMALFRACYKHTLKYHTRVLQMKDIDD